LESFGEEEGRWGDTTCEDFVKEVTRSWGSSPGRIDPRPRPDTKPRSKKKRKKKTVPCLASQLTSAEPCGKP